MTVDEYEDLSARLEKHYDSGNYYAQSVSGTIYLLATVLERVDNELLWCVLELYMHPHTDPQKASNSGLNVPIPHFSNISRQL